MVDILSALQIHRPPAWRSGTMLTSKGALTIFSALGLLVDFPQGTALKRVEGRRRMGSRYLFPQLLPAGLWVHLGRALTSVQGLLLYLQLSLSPSLWVQVTIYSLVPWGLGMVMIHKGGHSTIWDRFPPPISLFPIQPIL